jgi:plasmid stabilization system protein ParE
VVWTTRARDELRAIGEYIARDDPRAAERWVLRLVHAVEAVSALPSSGREVPELGRPEIREVIEGNYRIVYRLSDSTLAVLTVFEGHKLLDGIDE